MGLVARFLYSRSNVRPLLTNRFMNKQLTSELRHLRIFIFTNTDPTIQRSRFNEERANYSIIWHMDIKLIWDPTSSVLYESWLHRSILSVVSCFPSLSVGFVWLSWYHFCQIKKLLPRYLNQQKYNRKF